MDIDKLISTLPQNLDEAIQFVLTNFDQQFPRMGPNQYAITLEYYALIYSLLDNQTASVSDTDDVEYDQSGYPIFSALDFGMDEGYLTGFMFKRMAALKTTVKRNIDSQKFMTHVNNNKMKMGKNFSYHFNEDEISYIQKIINALRDEITSKDVFKDEHKQRILNRLEALQQELHKKMSDLDRFWGLIGDAGVALGKFGADAKPFADLIKDLTKVVWGAQARVEEIECSDCLPLLSNESGKAA